MSEITKDTCDYCNRNDGGDCEFQERRHGCCSCQAFSNKSYEAKPLSIDEKSLMTLCQEFCNTCSSEVVEKYGEGKLHNKPFNYFIYCDICESEIKMGKAYPWNRISLEKLFADLWACRDEMQADIDKAKEPKERE
jgi:hypothetical protein